MHWDLNSMICWKGEGGERKIMGGGMGASFGLMCKVVTVTASVTSAKRGNLVYCQGNRNLASHHPLFREKTLHPKLDTRISFVRSFVRM